LSRVVTRTKKEKSETHESKNIIGYYATITSLVRGLHKDIMLNTVKDTDMTIMDALNESTAVWQRIENELKGW